MTSELLREPTPEQIQAGCKFLYEYIAEAYEPQWKVRIRRLFTTMLAHSPPAPAADVERVAEVLEQSAALSSATIYEGSVWYRQLARAAIAALPSKEAVRAEEELAKLEASAALIEFEQAFIVAVGDKSPFAKAALRHVHTIRRALARQP